MAHTKRYRKLSEALCEETVEEFFRGKWRRRDVLAFVEKYAGIPRTDIQIETLTGGRECRNEAVKACGAALYETILQILEGITPDDIVPVSIRRRPDGATGKIRDIAQLCIMHQLAGCAVKKMLMPLFRARILPTQHASLPGRGQNGLKRQVHGYFLKKSLGIRYIIKTDVVHAYANTTYALCLALIQKELPKARRLHTLITYLGSVAPEGHLIIGGDLDAWLFNYVMSYAIRNLYTCGAERRGKHIPYIIRCDAYMDDFALMSRSEKGARCAARDLGRWLRNNFGMEMRVTTDVIRLLSVDEEARRRIQPHGRAARGCPALDMAGFRICRSHVMMRRRVFLAARRQFLRGYREWKRSGTLSPGRARSIISYHGYVEQTDSRYMAGKYHVKELMAIAKRVCSFYGRLEHRKRMEELNDLQKRRGGKQAGRSDTRNKAGREPDGAYGRQHPGGNTAGGRCEPDPVPF